MIIESLTEILSAIFNSVFGFMLATVAVFAIVFWLLNKLDPFQERWRQWEGSIITAIKLAEKQVPKDAPHAGATKLNTALDYVLQDYALANGGKRPSRKLARQLRQAIQTKHSDLDRFGGLSKA
jgi:hypothetical protein